LFSTSVDIDNLCGPKKFQKQTYPAAANIEKKKQSANTGFYSPFGC
jgi:hypothetical protein